jgi:hypothetical protein
MRNSLDHLPKYNPKGTVFDIESKDFRDSASDYEKMARDDINRGMGLPVDMVDMREKILSSLSISDRIALMHGDSIAGTLLGVPVNLHNYPNIGFTKELTLRETLQEEIDKWLC